MSDTAKILDISIPMVKTRLHQARRMLRRLLEPKLKAINTGSKIRF
jgi:DNA-directed RNA polymerase specialized sigma24 family protein